MDIGSYPTRRALRDAAKIADDGTVRSHLSELVKANVARLKPSISLNPDESTWDASALMAHVARKTAASTTTLMSPGELALANLRVTEWLKRLESQDRGGEFLPAEPRMQAEADSLRTRLALKILLQSPHVLYPIRAYLPETVLPERRFHEFYKRDAPILPKRESVVTWLQEITAALRSSLPQVAK